MQLQPAPETEPNSITYGFSSLYSKLQLSIAGFLGGPVTCLILLQENYLQLREYGKARRIFTYGCVFIPAYYLLIAWLTFRFYGMAFAAYTKFIPPALFELLSRSQNGRLTEYFEGGAVRQSNFEVAKYILYGLAIEAVLAMGAAYLMPHMHGPKVVVGESQHELFYAGMDDAEARKLADELVFLDHMKGREQVYLKAEKTGEGYRLIFPIRRSNAKDLEIQSYYSMLLYDLDGRTGKKNRGCFTDNPLALDDTLCFDQSTVTLLLPIQNRDVKTRQAVLDKVKAETDYFIALFTEAAEKKKSWVSWEKIPTIYIFASNGIAMIRRDRINERLAKDYGSVDNLLYALQILAGAFRNTEWHKDDNIFRQYVDALRQLKNNLESNFVPASQDEI